MNQAPNTNSDQPIEQDSRYPMGISEISFDEPLDEPQSPENEQVTQLLESGQSNQRIIEQLMEHNRQLTEQFGQLGQRISDYENRLQEMTQAQPQQQGQAQPESEPPPSPIVAAAQRFNETVVPRGEDESYLDDPITADRYQQGMQILFEGVGAQMDQFNQLVQALTQRVEQGFTEDVPRIADERYQQGRQADTQAWQRRQDNEKAIQSTYGDWLRQLWQQHQDIPWEAFEQIRRPFLEQVVRNEGILQEQNPEQVKAWTRQQLDQFESVDRARRDAENQWQQSRIQTQQDSAALPPAARPLPMPAVTNRNNGQQRYQSVEDWTPGTFARQVEQAKRQTQRYG